MSAPVDFQLFDPGYSFHHGGRVWHRAGTVLEWTNGWGEYRVPDNAQQCVASIDDTPAVIFEGTRSDDGAYGVVAFYFLPRPWYEIRQRTIDDQPLLATWSPRVEELPILRTLIYAVRGQGAR